MLLQVCCIFVFGLQIMFFPVTFGCKTEAMNEEGGNQVVMKFGEMYKLEAARNNETTMLCVCSPSVSIFCYIHIIAFWSLTKNIPPFVGWDDFCH